MKNLLIDLPEDLFINNILLSKVTLPIKSLLSLRCVCKYLKNLITSPAFINMHLHHTTSPTDHQLNNNQLVLFNTTLRRDVLNFLKFNDGSDIVHDLCCPEVVKFISPIMPTHIWGSCNGLLCLTEGDGYDGDDDVNKVCLWNPLTKEYKELPPPLPLMDEMPIGITEVSDYHGGSITYGFGYDRFIDDYKIIRCEHFVGEGINDGSITEFQVYTLGTNTWRKISPDNNPYKSYNVILVSSRNQSTVFVNGALHWSMSRHRVSRDAMTQAKIVSFDIEKEVFQEIQTPLICEKVCYCLSLGIRVLRGCLCILEYDDRLKRYCNVWMMMDYGVKESWTKLFVIQPLDHEYIFPAYYKLLRFCENGEIIIGEIENLIIYDRINNEARRVKIGGEIVKHLYQCEIYIESLVSVNTGVYKDEGVF